MQNIGFVGFGEAGFAFAKGLGGRAALLAYDAKLDDPQCQSAMRAQMQAGGAQPATSPLITLRFTSAFVAPTVTFVYASSLCKGPASHCRAEETA